MKAHALLCWFCTLLGSTAGAFAQGVGASGDIKGTIRDTSGAIMQNVAVAVVDAGKGIRRTATTDSVGQYRITGIPPAMYDVSVAMPGFESQVRKNVVVNLGETLSVDFRMKVSAGKEVVEVTSEPPVVDTARGSQSGLIEERSIQELPIDRRDYLTFSLLMPGEYGLDGELWKSLEPRENGEGETLGHKKLCGLSAPGDQNRGQQDTGRGPECGGWTELAKGNRNEQQRECNTESLRLRCPAEAGQRQTLTQTGSPVRPSMRSA